jgi:type IX secretion system PorP/SprF family membrane protein
MKKTLYLVLAFISFKAYCQQDSQYTQYMYNMSLINPAYATSDFNNFNVGLSHRQQWIGMDGTPQTTSAFTHYAINDFNELGFSFFNDNIGDGVLKENKLSVDYAYILNLNNYNKLSFGIKAGFNMLNVNFNNFDLESGNQYSDDLFALNQSRFYPNIGTGVFYYTKNSYLGLSVPNMLNSAYFKKTDNIYSKSSEEMHYYFSGGYVFESRRDNLKIKPSFLAKSSNYGKLSLDLSVNALFNEKFELGMSYRLKSSVNLLTNFAVNDNLRIGYSYDYSLTNLSSFNTGSHEIVLLYDFNLNGTNSKSPRFF